MGYLLTFGIVFDNDQRLISNHFQALEMTLGASPCNQLRRNPYMIIFGDPKGYLMTFGKISIISYDAQQ